MQNSLPVLQLWRPHGTVDVLELHYLSATATALQKVLEVTVAELIVMFAC